MSMQRLNPSPNTNNSLVQEPREMSLEVQLIGKGNYLDYVKNALT